MTSEARGPLWRDACAEHVTTAPLDADGSADLVVIGGGYTGCAAALAAAEAGAAVRLLEAVEIGFGGSGRNVGLVNAGLWLPPEALIAALGPDAGQRLIDALAVAPDAVFGLIDAHGIACDPVRAGTLHCAHAPAGLRDLDDRFRQGNRQGAPLRLLDAAETRRRTGAAGLHGALLDPRAGTIQPLAYCIGLARAAAAAGAVLHDRSAVSALGHDGDCWQVTANGHRLRARAVLLATNAYHAGLTGVAPPQFVPVSYSQFATEPMPAALRAEVLPGGEGCWDTAPVMSSFRVDAAGRMVFGGIGDVTGAGRAVHRAWARRKLRQLFPRLDGLAIRHVWQGRIAMTRDHIPKLLAFGPNALAAFGYSGRGIGPGTVFGSAAARALLTGDAGALPVTPVSRHAEPFRSTRAAVFEIGATLVHAVGAPPFGARR